MMMTRSLSITCPVFLGCYHSKSNYVSDSSNSAPQTINAKHDHLGEGERIKPVVIETPLGPEVVLNDENKYVAGKEVLEDKIIANKVPTLQATPPVDSSKSHRMEWTDPLSQLPPNFDRNYLDFPFFTGSKTFRYLTSDNAKVMFIMRGVSGSGKSSIVDIFKSTYDATVCSSDSYFITDEGVYNFDLAKLGNAHGFCKHKAKLACETEEKVIVIDNTNVKRWEMKSYLELAKQFGYVVVLVEPKTDWKFNPKELALRNKHGVPLEVIEKKVNAFDHIIPMYYGWFVSHKKSNQLMSLASKIFLECLDNFPTFRSALGMDHVGSRDEESQAPNSIAGDYYCDRGKSGPLLHCTACFCANGKAPGGKKYGTRTDILASCGRVFKLTLTGLVMTRKTLGLRVTLDDEERGLYLKPEESSWTGMVNYSQAGTGSSGCAGEGDGISVASLSLSASPLLLSSAPWQDDESPKTKKGRKKKGERPMSSKKQKRLLARDRKLAGHTEWEGGVEVEDNQSHRSCPSPDLVPAQNDVIIRQPELIDEKVNGSGEVMRTEHFDQPTGLTGMSEDEPSRSGGSGNIINAMFPALCNSGFSRSAHITMRMAPGVQSKETNFDMLAVCDTEHAWKDLAPSVFRPVTKGKAAYFNDGVCCVYFSQPIKINTIFSGYY